MSEENVAIVRRLFELFANREHERAFDYYDPEIEWDATAAKALLPPGLGAMHRGHEGVRAYWREWLSAWSDLQFELSELVDAGDDVVAVVRNQRQTGRHSGIVTEVPDYALVFTLREGKVVRWRIFPSPAAALEAVGLTTGESDR